MKRGSLLVLCSLWLTAFIPQTAVAMCFDNWACIDVEQRGDTVEFWASNQRPFPFTATVMVRATNLSHQGVERDYFEHTDVIEGNKRVLMLRLKRATAGDKYRFSDDFRWTPGNMHARHDQQVYHYPFAPGEKYRMVQGFGGGFSHRGASRYAVDFAMPVGTPVHAARGGVVIDLVEHHNRGGASRRYSRYANFVNILHSDGTTGEYYHLKQHGAAVEIGDTVKAGDLIGFSGNTGFSSLPHLHFAVYRAKSHGNYESLPFSFGK